MAAPKKIKQPKPPKPNKLQKLVEKGADGRRLPVQSPRELEFKYTEGQHRLRGNVNRATPPDSINLPDNSKPKPVKTTTAPKRSGSTSAKEIWDKSVRGKKTPAPKAPTPKASVGASNAGRVLRVAGRLAGPVGALVAMTTPAGEGSDKPSGPLMRGTKRKPAPGSNYGVAGKAPGSTDKPKQGKMQDRILPEATPGAKSKNMFAATGPIAKARETYRTTAFNIDAMRIKAGNPGMPKATGAESVGGSSGGSSPGTGYPKPSSGGSGLSSGSASPPAYAAPDSKTRVGGKVTSGVTMFFAGTGGRNSTRPETRYQRDSGLAMDSRKKK